MRLKQRTVSQDVNYIVRNGEVVIVDEFTGRVLPGRRWSDGLHQIEAKERVEIQPETQRHYLSKPVFAVSKISRDDRNCKTEEVEFEKIYKLEVTVIHQ